MMGFIDRCNDFIVKRAITLTANKMKQLDLRDYVKDAEEVANNIYVEFAGARRERFFAFHIDLEGRIIERQVVSVGTIDSAPAHIREIARTAILNDTSGIILAHTHIAHDSDPSPGDIKATEQIMAALGTLNIFVFDHIIVSKSGYYSFREEGNLFDKEKEE